MTSPSSDALVNRLPELTVALAGELELGKGWTPTSGEWFQTAWARHPLGEGAGRLGLCLEGGLLVARPRLPGNEREEFLDLTRELVEYRLLQLRDRERQDLEGPSF